MVRFKLGKEFESAT